MSEAALRAAAYGRCPWVRDQASCICQDTSCPSGPVESSPRPTPSGSSTHPRSRPDRRIVRQRHAGRASWGRDARRLKRCIRQAHLPCPEYPALDSLPNRDLGFPIPSVPKFSRVSVADKFFCARRVLRVACDPTYFRRKVLYSSLQVDESPVYPSQLPNTCWPEPDWYVPSQRAPMPRPFSHCAQSVIAFDHSPLTVYRFDSAYAWSVLSTSHEDCAVHARRMNRFSR